MELPEHHAVLCVGVLYQPADGVGDVTEALIEQFGDIRTTGTPYEFDFTDYYQSEMGASLHRQWLVFEHPVDQAHLKSNKQACMSIERNFEHTSGDRTHNIDPGHVTGTSFILSSRKNHATRICLGDGIFAEVMLWFEQNEWNTLPKTYEDLSEPKQHRWLDQARDHWLTLHQSDS